MSRIVTWNVNGARSLAPTPLAFRTLLDSFEADVICLQETKIARDKLHAHQDVALVPGYDVFFSCSRVSGKSAYAGVATYCRSNALPVAAEEGFTGRLTNVAAGRAWDTIGGSLPPFCNFSEAELLAFDNEGRCVITDHVDFVLFNIYFPATGETDARYVFKINFYYALQERVTTLIDSGRHVIIVGDVNATYAPIDHVRWNQPRAAVSFAAGVRLPGGEVTAVGGVVVGAPTTNSSNGGGALEADPAFPELEDMETSPATKWMRAMLVSGGGHFIDTFRVFHPTQEQAYTCWNNLTNARASNYGTRLDYVLADAALVARGFFADVRIRPDVMGSDHCPVMADLTAKLAIAPHQAPALCTKYMKELSGKQTSLKELFQARAASSTPVSAAATPSDVGSVASDGASDTSSHATPTPTPSGSTATPLARGSGSGGAGVAKQAKLNAFFTRTAKPGASTSAAASALGKGQIETTFTPMTTVAPAMIDRGITPTSDLEGSIDQPMPDALTTSTSMTTAVRSEALAAVGVVEATAAANSAAAASAWRALLDTTPKQVTCRGHGEPCILLTVNKKGPNTGRKFYMCARPVGDKHDPAARCDFFAWATQLKGHGARIVKSLPGKAAAQSDRDRARPYPDRSGGPAGV